MSLQQEQEKCQYTFTTVFEVRTSANKKKSSCMSDYTGQYNHSVRHNTNPQHNDTLVPITRIQQVHSASQQHWMRLCQFRHNCSRECQRIYTNDTDAHRQDQQNRHIPADKEAQGNFWGQQQTHHVDWHTTTEEITRQHRLKQHQQTMPVSWEVDDHTSTTSAGVVYIHSVSRHFV